MSVRFNLYPVVAINLVHSQVSLAVDAAVSRSSPSHPSQQICTPVRVRSLPQPFPRVMPGVDAIPLLPCWHQAGYVLPLSLNIPVVTCRGTYCRHPLQPGWFRVGKYRRRPHTVRLGLAGQVFLYTGASGKRLFNSCLPARMFCCSLQHGFFGRATQYDFF